MAPLIKTQVMQIAKLLRIKLDSRKSLLVALNSLVSIKLLRVKTLIKFNIAANTRVKRIEMLYLLHKKIATAASNTPN